MAVGGAPYQMMWHRALMRSIWDLPASQPRTSHGRTAAGLPESRGAEARIRGHEETHETEAFNIDADGKVELPAVSVSQSDDVGRQTMTARPKEGQVGRARRRFK